jgi:hypothetical protein
MTIPPQDDDAWLERVEELAEQHPIPADLARQIADQIEPVTMNSGVDHGDVMGAIDVAFPLILGYFRLVKDLDETMLRHFAPEE